MCNMSYTDPLIKELKGYTLKLTEEVLQNAQILDSSNELTPLCEIIEKIFLKGCLRHAWCILDDITNLMNLGHVQKSFVYLRTMELVKSCPKVMSVTGKLRLLIRSCLVNKCLHVPVEIMVRSYSDLTWNWYDLEGSILGNEILGEIFLSVILQCSTLLFKLDLKNSRFLDLTLVLPHFVYIEFVPCNSLGVAVSFVDDKAVVIQVDEKSVAAEDDKVEVGDILDELNGNILHSEMRGQLRCIMTRGKNKPVVIRLIKARNPINGSIFPPIDILLRKININIEKREKYGDKVNGNGNKIDSKYSRFQNEVNYVGSIVIGEEGHVKMIEYAILQLVKKPQKWMKVRIECHELDLKVYVISTGELLMSSSFMEISSCGQTKKHPDYFGYIAGDNLCNLASKFTCHVFQSKCDFDIQIILQSIGKGFQRTHFAV